MKESEVRGLINDYVALDEEIKRLERRRDILKEQVINLGEGSHRGSLGSVSVSLSQRTTFDQKKLKEDFGTKLEPYYKTSNSVTVRVTVFEEKPE